MGWGVARARRQLPLRDMRETCAGDTAPRPLCGEPPEGFSMAECEAVVLQTRPPQTGSPGDAALAAHGQVKSTPAEVAIPPGESQCQVTSSSHKHRRTPTGEAGHGTPACGARVPCAECGARGARGAGGSSLSAAACRSSAAWPGAPACLPHTPASVCTCLPDGTQGGPPDRPCATSPERMLRQFPRCPPTGQVEAQAGHFCTGHPLCNRPDRLCREGRGPGEFSGV